MYLEGGTQCTWRKAFILFVRSERPSALVDYNNGRQQMSLFGHSKTNVRFQLVESFNVHVRVMGQLRQGRRSGPKGGGGGAEAGGRGRGEWGVGVFDKEYPS